MCTVVAVKFGCSRKHRWLGRVLFDVYGRGG